MKRAIGQLLSVLVLTLGMVHSTSSEALLVFPADYPFVSDSGTHTFSGLTLRTFRSQSQATVTVNDAGTAATIATRALSGVLLGGAKWG